MEDAKLNKSDEFTFKDLGLLIKDWYSYILSKYKIIVLAGLLGGILGIVYSYIKKPLYTATLTFALEDENSGGLGGALGIVGQFGLDVGGGGGGVFSGTNIFELFKSRSMIEKTLLTSVNQKGKKISLAEMYIQDNELREGWSGRKDLKSIQFLPDANRDKFTRTQDSILETISNNISKSMLNVEQKEKEVSIISLEIKSGDEVFSKVFCETLADVVSEFYIETKSKKASINMVILQRQLDSIRNELNSSIKGVAVANDQTFNLNPALNVKRVPSARRNVDVQANTAILTELVKQTELAKVTLRKETPLIQVVDSPIYPLKKEKFGRLKGLIFGGFLGGFFTVLYLIIRRFYKNFNA